MYYICGNIFMYMNSFFAALFDFLFLTPLFLDWLIFLLCLLSFVFRFKNFFKKERFFWKHGRMPTRRFGTTWVVVLPIFHQKRKGCFSKQTKVKNTFSQTSRNIKKWMLKEQSFEIFPSTERKFRKNNFGDVRKGFFLMNFFRKNKIGKCNKEKRRNQKRRRNTEGVSKKEMKRGRRFSKDEREKKSFFGVKKRCLATKKKESNNEEGGQRERGTSGGYIQRSGNMKRVNRWKK